MVEVDDRARAAAGAVESTTPSPSSPLLSKEVEYLRVDEKVVELLLGPVIVFAAGCGSCSVGFILEDAVVVSVAVDAAVAIGVVVIVGGFGMMLVLLALTLSFFTLSFGSLNGSVNGRCRKESRKMRILRVSIDLIEDGAELAH